METSLNSLAEDNSEIANDLQSQMLALALLVDSDSSSITALHTQVSALSGSLTLLNAHFNRITSRYIQFTSLLETLNTTIGSLQQQVPTLYALTDDIINTEGISFFTYVDEPDSVDEFISDNLRTFFADHYDEELPVRYVYFNFDTGGIRTTELCVYDRSAVFAPFASKEPNYSVQNYGPPSDFFYYRYGSGSWQIPSYYYRAFRVYSNLNDGIDYLNFRALYVYGLEFSVRHQDGAYSYYDTSHQNQYWTLYSSIPTRVSVIIGDSFNAACGH